jgi:hypothetical protein
LTDRSFCDIQRLEGELPKSLISLSEQRLHRRGSAVADNKLALRSLAVLLSEWPFGL